MENKVKGKIKEFFPNLKMADQVGVIDTSLIREEEKRKRREEKERKEKYRRRKEKDAYEDLGRKAVPECVLMERESQRRKDIQRMRMKRKNKKEKYAREAAYAKYAKKHGHSKYGGSYGSKDKDEEFFIPRTGFGNGGEYRYKSSNKR